MNLNQVVILILFMFSVLGFLITLIVLFKRGNRRHKIEKQLLQAEYQQELLRTQLEIQEHTFNNISQEIHDNIGQALSLAKLNLNTLHSPDTPKLETTRELLSKAITDLRDLSRSLHGEKIAEIGLQQAIMQELNIVQRSGQLETELAVTGKPFSLSAQIEMILFRIIQEALHNTVKHAQAQTLALRLDYTTEQLNITIADNGKGFSPERLSATQTGIGLKNMRNRAALVNAGFTLQSEPGNGTLIRILVNEPLNGNG